MSILDLLLDKEKWQAFFKYKTLKSNFFKFEEEELAEFIKNEKYLSVAKQIVCGTYVFSYPQKKFINKSGSAKKRVVYSFNEVETIILKFIVFYMSKYDNCFCDNCFSFRKNFTIKKAFAKIVDNDIANNYSYKLDISNYFNSIDVLQLLPILKNILANDLRLYTLFEELLTTNKCIFNKEIIEEHRGAMAGTPMSAFFANIYLLELDKYFSQNKITYARYSDDIIVFDKTLDKLNHHITYIKDVLIQKKLEINRNKEYLFLPQQPWHYLGLEYDKGMIDISVVSLNKIKGKIRRKARALYRWKIKNNKTTEHAIKVMICVFNKKFYATDKNKDLSWSKWFFPVITTHNTLKVIDKYLVQYLRYLHSGRFSKQNYNITYEYLKSLGYKSLVNEYHKYKKQDK